MARGRITSPRDVCLPPGRIRLRHSVLDHRGRYCVPYVANVFENATGILNSEVHVLDVGTFHAELSHMDASEG